MLAHAIVREGAKAVAAGMNPMDLKRGVDLAVEAVVEDLKKNSKKVTSNEEIAQVGTISANGDQEIGRFLADAMKKVGNEGVITIEEPKSLETELEVVEGMQFDRGYISPYFVTNADKMRVEMEDPARWTSPGSRFTPTSSGCSRLRGMRPWKDAAPFETVVIFSMIAIRSTRTRSERSSCQVRSNRSRCLPTVRT